MDSSDSSTHSFSLALLPLAELAPGIYTGSILLQAFQDAAFSKPIDLTGGSLTYRIQVDPELTLTVKIDGVVESETFSSSHHAIVTYNPLLSTLYWNGEDPTAAFEVHPGQLIEVEASLPVDWIGSDQTGGAYSSSFEPPLTSETTFAQVMPALRDGATRMINVTFAARPKTGDQWGSAFRVDISIP